MTQEQRKLLDKLETKSIVSIAPNDIGGITMTEECDHYYSVELSRDELGHLVDYLKSIYDAKD